ncbi:hypothetical protein D0812_29740 (plasmid) [Vibrio owensii]|nr:MULTISPECIES: hypothetical protein [Vibrio harveyi group]AYO18601.1 hypothetical protein D0812_29740 [Vibrio owensii]EGQ8532976.1 hypothetical protein [Vibrio parahaemolyticus]EHR5480105.1 hypothetical protein [Vibrio parahaemolyticus]EJB8691529.1 hypothetical protein [Vibrio parahaemolyticus]EJL3960436.1 hypothetical protein [Vibrio parahaemolyticus]
MNAELIIGTAFLFVGHFTYKQVYVKTKRLSIQRHLFALQCSLRDELVQQEENLEEENIKTFLMVDNGLNRTYQTLSSSMRARHSLKASHSDSNRKSHFLKRLEQTRSPQLTSIIQKADELLRQEFNVDTPFTRIVVDSNEY